jgi:cytochrome P450
VGATRMEEHFDHNDPELVTTMRDRFARMRKTCPVMYSEVYDGFWVISRYSDVVAALQDHRRFSSADGIMIPSHKAVPVPAIPTASDQPLHMHYRRALWPFLTPGAVARYEPLVRETVTSAIDDFIETGRADVMKQLATPVPARVVGRFFGFSADEGVSLCEWFDTLLSSRDEEEAQRAGAQIFEFCQASLDDARSHPGGNVSSAIVGYEGDGRRFTNEECLGLLFTSIGGALDTTVSAIGHAVNLLWRNPDQRNRLIQNSELSLSATEEILRMAAPAIGLARTVIQKCEIGDAVLAPGDRVLLLLDSANYDEDVFKEPEAFIVDRPNNPHVSLGWGIHKCAGQHLVRLELRVVVEELVRRVPDYEIVSTPTFTTTGQTHMPKNIHITFEPGPRL